MERNKYKFLIISLIFILLFFPTVTAEEESEIESVGEMKGVPTTLAPNWVIKKANEYLISLYGKDFSEKNFKFYSGSGHMIYYKYIPSGLFVSIEISPEGNVLSFEKGPKKSYKFLITKKEAEAIARANGILGNVTTYIRYVPEDFNYKLDFTSGNPVKVEKEQKVNENYVWSIEISAGTGEVHAYTPYFMFVDVDTGKVLYIEYFDAAIGTVALGNTSGIYDDEKPKEICKINETKSINNYSFYCNSNFWQLQKQKIEEVYFLIRLFKFLKNLF